MAPSTAGAKDPLVAPEKMTSTIKKLERQRDGIRQRRDALNEELIRLEARPKTPDTLTKISRVKDAIGKTDAEEAFVKFQIIEELRRPTEAPAAEPRGKKDDAPAPPR
jgi:hypothetical protein